MWGGGTWHSWPVRACGLPCPGPGLCPEAATLYGPAAGCSPEPEHWILRLLQVHARGGTCTEWPAVPVVLHLELGAQGACWASGPATRRISNWVLLPALAATGCPGERVGPAEEGGAWDVPVSGGLSEVWGLASATKTDRLEEAPSLGPSAGLLGSCVSCMGPRQGCQHSPQIPCSGW